MRDYSDQKSNFCNKSKASFAMESMVKNTLSKIILLSYNDEGQLSKEEITEILSKYGNVEIIYKDHVRYKSNNHKPGVRKMVKEKLYILHKN
jgi:adenine-specific DNA-methyltransferase